MDTVISTIANTLNKTHIFLMEMLIFMNLGQYHTAPDSKKVLIMPFILEIIWHYISQYVTSQLWGV